MLLFLTIVDNVTITMHFWYLIISLLLVLMFIQCNVELLDHIIRLCSILQAFLYCFLMVAV